MPLEMVHLAAQRRDRSLDSLIASSLSAMAVVSSLVDLLKHRGTRDVQHSLGHAG